MPLFDYHARNVSGKPVQGQQEAPTEALALRLLQSRDLLVTKIALARAAGGPAALKKTVRRRQKIRQEDILFFIQQTAELIEVGVPLVRALELVGGQVESGRLYQVVDQIKSGVRAGLSFHESLAKHPKIFPPLWIFLIEAGETAGNLPLLLKRLVQYLESNLSLRRKITSALVYPAILVFGAIIALVIFLVKIVPIFSKLFDSFDAKLPPFTVMVISLSTIAQRYFLLVVFFGAAVFYALRQYRQTPLGLRQMDAFTLNVPLFGGFVRDAIIARVTLNLATLLTNGVSILQTLDIVSRTAGNVIYETALTGAIQDIRQGRTLSAAFEKTGLFSPLVISMIVTGEESGRLAYMMEKVSAYYQARVDVFAGRLGEIIGPLVIVFVGGVIGVLVVAMFLPIFNLGSAIR